MPDEPTQTSEFADLLQKAAQGDQSAQAIICDRYERQVRIVVRVLLGPRLRQHLDSADLMQSVHGCILHGLQNQQFEIATPEKLIALASTLARRKIARKWRTHRRQISDASGNANDSSISPKISDIVPTDSVNDPQLVAEYNDVFRDIVQRLSEPERVMLEMRLEGFSTKEIAGILDLHPVAVRVRWTRLKQRLQTSGIDRSWSE